MASKRNIYIINPRFQYKFCLYMCTFVLISSLIYPFTIYDIYEKVIYLQPQRLTDFQSSRQELLFFLTFIQLCIMIFFFLICIFLSHKIAGPMFKLKMHLQKLRSGEPFSPLFFRKGDHFPEIAQEVNQFLDHILENRERDFAYLEEVKSYIKNINMVLPEDKKPVVDEIINKLDEISKRYKDQIESE